MTFPERDGRTWNGRVSAEYGCTVTFENDGGTTLVLTGTGPPRQVLRDLCEQALFADPSFRVIGYSTPETIRYDLRGRYSGKQLDPSGGAQSSPEGRALGTAGLFHLLHPRLHGRYPITSATRERRAHKRKV